MYRFAIVLITYILYTIFLTNEVNSARILAVFPMPSLSHQLAFRGYTQELAKRGHELVVITPHPALPKDRPKDNVTEIDVGFVLKLMDEFFKKYQSNLKRGVIADIDMFNADTYSDMLYLITEQYNHAEVKQLLEDPNQHFDLLVTEALFDYILIFSKIFNVPAIQLSSYYGSAENFETVGGVSRHPLLYPHIARSKFGTLTFWEKIMEVYNELKLKYLLRVVEQQQNNFLNKNFKEQSTTVSELKENVQMLFVNSYPIFDNNRPIPPSVVYLGAIHLQPVKELPMNLKDYLDKSKHGVVYISFGGNVSPKQMDKDLLDAILNAVKKLPYDFLWKFDGDKIDNMPKNLRIQKWFPQRDLLTHPNVKAFITQGGVQSTDEAIDAGVPLVGVPMLGDQWYNVQKYEDLKIGIKLDGRTVTTEDLVQAVKKVIEDDRHKIKWLRSMINDQPQRPLDRAVWWTEHVLRYGGARHLRTPAANISWSEYLMIDVVAVLVMILIVILIAISVLLYYIVRLIIKWYRGIFKQKIN